jgi:hypothetical protein
VAVIDVIAHDAAADEYELIIAFRDWSETELPELQQKLNDYLAFALDGQMAEMYPESVGKRARIHVDLPREPSAPVREFLAAAEHEVIRHGLGFVVNVAPSD